MIRPKRALIGRIAALVALSLLLVAGATGEVAAKAGEWFRTDHGSVRLIASSGAVGSDGSVRLGLHFRMKKGWKIYWRSPGDAGFPPQPNWAGSKNLAKADIEWPLPERFEVLGLTTTGYKDEVVLPVDARLFEPGRPLDVHATVAYLTCDDICVPYEAKLALSLPAGPETSTPEAGLIERFAARVPPRGGDPLVAGVWLDRGPEGPVLRIAARTEGQFVRPDVLVEGPPGFRFAPPRTELAEGGRSAVLHVAVSPPPGAGDTPAPPSLEGKPVTLTLIDRGRGVEHEATVQPGETLAPAATSPETARNLPAGEPDAAGWDELATILALALLGGLILNLMPCVLPVLSIKLLSVVGHGGAERGRVRAGFLASAAGIVASFLVLGTAAVGLKAAGLAAGWGIQFQQPLFLLVMAIVVALFAANLWGLFDVTLPAGMTDAAAKAGHGRHLGGHFAMGAFATLLATPCTAPFLGTAVGFALSRGAGEIYAVFTALGLGLAAPYLLVAAVPRLATSLPKPGRWMVTLRRILGLALAGTAVWLLTVLEAQVGMAAAVTAGAALLAMLGALAVAKYSRRKLGPLGWGLVGLFALAAVVLPGQLQKATMQPVSGAPPAKTAGLIRWQPFDPDAIAGHVAAGRVVFVDVTAEWCITCQVNKSVALESREVARQLNAAGVVAMQADWTRPDPVISAFLQRFRRYGIPFNVVFGPAVPEGHTLPELLTRAGVLSALDAAGGRPAVAGR